MSRWPVHPAADLFPEPTSEEYKALLEDIRVNGVATPIVIYKKQLLDGRTRLRACEELAIECPYREWEGESPVGYAVSLNLKRRSLTVGQRAAIAVEMLPLLEAEGRKRMAAARSARWERQKDKTQNEKLEKGRSNLDLPSSQISGHVISDADGKSTTVAGQIVGVSRLSVVATKQLQNDAPDLFDQVKAGAVTIHKATTQLRRQKQAAERKAVLEAVALQPDGERRQVKVGDWWQLGEHLVFCGDTSTPAFIEHCPEVEFAFADPPYGVGKAEWDSKLIWAHDWLADKAKIVAVTPGSTHLQDFLGLTSMPYKWPMACLISNGMTKGAIGFANWILTIVFAHESVNRNKQDATTITIDNSQAGDTTHPSRKPAAMMAWLLQTFTKEGDTVLDPFLGSGTTLMAAQAMGRRCIGGEIEPSYVEEIIGRWEVLTKQKATRVEPDKV